MSQREVDDAVDGDGRALVVVDVDIIGAAAVPEWARLRLTPSSAVSQSEDLASVVGGETDQLVLARRGGAAEAEGGVVARGDERELVVLHDVHLWAGQENFPGGRIDDVDAVARSAVDADEVVDARVAHHPESAGAPDESDDVAVHVHEPQVAASDGFFFVEGAGVDEERALWAAAKTGLRMRSRHRLDTHRNRQTDLTGVLERMSKTAWYGNDDETVLTSPPLSMFQFAVSCWPRTIRSPLLGLLIGCYI